MSEYWVLALDDEDDYAYDGEHIDLESELGIYGPDDEEEEELDMEPETQIPLEPQQTPVAPPAPVEPVAAAPVDPRHGR